jgi:hypothetical protein
MQAIRAAGYDPEQANWPGYVGLVVIGIDAGRDCLARRRVVLNQQPRILR